MTLRLRQGGEDERLTFYVAPEAFGRMKEAWARIERVLGQNEKRAAEDRDHADQ
jgi:hypothetical protein